MGEARLGVPDMQILMARWRRPSESGVEHLVMRHGDHDIVAESALLSGSTEDAFAATYRIVCDANWRVREVEVAVVGAERKLILTASGSGAWWSADGTPVPALDGAIDVDITATPFTNTLPIRRLEWAAGRSVEIVVAYVSVPELTVTAERQRYTCLDRGQRFRFESVGSDFVRDIEVDQHGLVVAYPGLFTRVA